MSNIIYQRNNNLDHKSSIMLKDIHSIFAYNVVAPNTAGYSYNFGAELYNKILEFKPKRVVEFGPKFGYTTLFMATALADLGQGKLKTYDLWQDKHEMYKNDHFTSFDKKVFEKCIDTTLKKYPTLEDYIEYDTKDYYKWLDSPFAFDFDLLYVDINNTGDTILKTYNRLKEHINNGAIVIFAGGNKVKDNHRMYKGLTPIHPLKDEIGYTIIHDDGSSASLSMIGWNTKE